MFAQIVIFKLKAPELRDKFLSLTAEMAAWLHQQPGFISYDLVESETAWSDRLVWKTREHEERGRTVFLSTDLAKKMLRCVEPDYRSVAGELLAIEN